MPNAKLPMHLISSGNLSYCLTYYNATETKFWVPIQGLWDVFLVFHCHLVHGFLRAEDHDTFYFINIVWKDNIKVLVKPG